MKNEKLYWFITLSMFKSQEINDLINKPRSWADNRRLSELLKDAQSPKKDPETADEFYVYGEWLFQNSEFNSKSILTTAHTMGSPEATFRLGFIIGREINLCISKTDENKYDPETLYREAYAAGNLDAAHSLGVLYYNKALNDEPCYTYEMAFQLLSLAVNGGNTYANKNLAIMYEKGRGCTKNLVKVAELLKTSTRDPSMCRCQLINMYYNNKIPYRLVAEFVMVPRPNDYEEAITKVRLGVAPEKIMDCIPTEVVQAYDAGLII